MRPVAILGCGPAGLLAAHAVALAGRPVAVFSKKSKSPIGGAQFLHEAIPGVTNTEPDAVIQFVTRGTKQGYMEKVYGTNPLEQPPFVSFPDRPQSQPAWHLQEVYGRLWDQYEGAINDVSVSPKWLDEEASTFDLIISTIPLPLLCRSRAGMKPGNCRFTVQEVLILNRNISGDCPNNSVLYNGDKSPSWYRTSHLFGVGSTEWSLRSPKPPLPDLATFQKPLLGVCDCNPDVVRAGRFGEWKKGVLVNDAFRTALQACMDHGWITKP